MEGFRRVKLRSDAWTEEDDQILTETVISSVKSGETQLIGFEKAAIRLERTAAACGFRWNGVLRHEHTSSLQEAKVEGRRKRIAPRRRGFAFSALSLEESISLLQEHKEKYEKLVFKCESLEAKIALLETIVSELSPSRSQSSQAV